MARKPDPFLTDEKNPEWQPEGAKPFGEVFPKQLEGVKNRGGRPRAATPKVHLNFRLAADLVAGIKGTGRGYNARVEKVLREALANGKL
jgi:uncharacterized protein (DUF4415 family)